MCSAFVTARQSSDRSGYLVSPLHVVALDRWCGGCPAGKEQHSLPIPSAIKHILILICM